MLTPEEWHLRYRRQIAWTRAIQEHLFSKLSLPSNAALLEVGCGTGALIENLTAIPQSGITGLDIKPDHLAFAASTNPAAAYVRGDALSLPFPSQNFDMTCCHFFLMWVQNPAIALTEMVRVTRRGGVVAALAEPDYAARIDHPEPLSELGRLQGLALQRQGADVTLGRRLTGLLNEAGLKQVQAGLLGGEWGGASDNKSWENEWAILEDDLQGLIPSEDFASLRKMDSAAWRKGERILFVPTFYAYGIVP